MPEEDGNSQKGRLIALAGLALVAVIGVGVLAATMLTGSGDEADEAVDQTTTVAPESETTEAAEPTTTEPPAETTTTTGATTATSEAATTEVPVDQPTFVEVTDDSGYLAIKVPDDWEIDGRLLDGFEDLQAVGDPGAIEMYLVITEQPIADQMMVLIEGWECEIDGVPYDYDDGLFVGLGANYLCPGATEYEGQFLVVEHPTEGRVVVDTFLLAGPENQLIRDRAFDSFTLKP